MLNLSEFRVLTKSKALVDCYENKEFDKLSEMLLAMLKVLDLEESKSCLSMINKISDNMILNVFSENVDFVKHYVRLFLLVNEEKYKEVCQSIKEIYWRPELPYQPESLVELWTNCAAVQEDIPEYKQAKRIKVEVLGRLGKKDEAKVEYKKLLKMGMQEKDIRHFWVYF